MKTHIQVVITLKVEKTVVLHQQMPASVTSILVHSVGCFLFPIYIFKNNLRSLCLSKNTAYKLIALIPFYFGLIFISEILISHPVII